MPAKTRGQIAFEAYNQAGANPGKTFDGRAVPEWSSLNNDVRAKWQAAALAVLAAEKEALTGAPTEPTQRPERKGILTLIRPPCPECRTMTCTCSPRPA